MYYKLKDVQYVYDMYHNFMEGLYFEILKGKFKAVSFDQSLHKKLNFLYIPTAGFIKLTAPFPQMDREEFPTNPKFCPIIYHKSAQYSYILL